MRHPCIIACAVLMACAGAAMGQAYEEHHPFTMRLRVRPGDVYRGAWNYWAYANEFHAPPACADENLKTNTIILPPGPAAQTITTRPLICVPDAQANAGFSLALDAMGHPTGSVDVWGHGILNPPPPPQQRAFARSTSLLYVKTGTVDARGRIRWRPTWHTAARISANSRTQSRDPISLSALDLDTGVLTETELWDSFINLVGGGESHWDNGLLTIDGMEGEFYVTMDSPFLTSGRGAMRMKFAGGLVTESIDDGIWDGLLPAVGDPSTGISLRLGDAEGAFDLDFDLGSTSVQGYEMTAGFGNEGEAFDEIPAPGGVLMLGLAGLLTPRRRRA